MSLQHLALALLHFLWQGTLIAAVYGIVRSLASKPEFRYASGCIALAAMAAAPIVTFLAFGEPPLDNGTFGVVGSIASSAVPADSRWLAPLHAAASGAGSESSAFWIVLAWFAGALVLSVRLIGAGIAASRLRFRKARPAPPNGTNRSTPCVAECESQNPSDSWSLPPSKFPASSAGSGPLFWPRWAR